MKDKEIGDVYDGVDNDEAGDRAELVEQEEALFEGNKTAVGRKGEMEEKGFASGSSENEKRTLSKGLVYLALALSAVALVLSFWNVGLHRIIGGLEKENKLLEHKQKVLENDIANLSARSLLAKLQVEVQRVYLLTMGERDFSAAAKVLSGMKHQVAGLKKHYSNGDLKELEFLMAALEKEVAKGPSTIPGLVSRFQSVVDRLGREKLAAVAASVPVSTFNLQPKSVAEQLNVREKQPESHKERSKVQEKRLKPQEKPASENASKFQKKPVIGQGGEEKASEEEKPVEKKAESGPAAIPEGKGFLGKVLRFFDELGGELVGGKR